MSGLRAIELGEAIAAAIRERPHTLSLVVRVSAWGSRATFEASGTGNGPALVVLSGKDYPVLAAVDAALARWEALP